MGTEGTRRARCQLLGLLLAKTAQFNVMDPCRPGPDVPVTVGSVYKLRVYLTGEPRKSLSKLVSSGHLPVSAYEALVKGLQQQGREELRPYLVRCHFAFRPLPHACSVDGA